MGDVWSMELCGDGFSGLEYCLETESGEQPDIYGREFRGREQWGDLSSVKRPVRSCFVLEDFDWEDDRPLKYAFGEMVIYRLHPRWIYKACILTHLPTGERLRQSRKNSLYERAGHYDS